MKDLSKDYEILLHRSMTGDIKVDVLAQNETHWLSQNLMAELFKTSSYNIGLHQKIFLQMESWCNRQLPRISRYFGRKGKREAK